ncbi:MAG TPA: hypothetical protein VII47_03730 [Actinomycetota bacterium]
MGIVGRLHGARRIAVWLALTAAWAGITLVLASHPERPRGTTPPGSGLFGSGNARTAPGVGAGTPGFGSSADEPANAPPEIVAALPEARRVASAFATAYATWRSDESPDAATARLVPYVTPDLAAKLRTPASGGTAARQTLAQKGEFATAVAEAVQTQSLWADGITLLVLVRQQLHTAAGVETRRPSYAVQVVRSPTGGQWLVRDFTP